MNKYAGILFASILALAISSPAYAEKNPEESVDHSEHVIDRDDHSDHNMDHGEHTMDHDDHDDHSDHKDMTHGDDHMMEDPPSAHEKHMTGDDSHTAHHGDHHHHMDDDHIMDHEGGMIMGQNFHTLPSSCNSISEEIEITVRAGRKYARKFPGVIFAFDQQEWRVKPCAKVTWHFINEDQIRHQFMIHGLPKYLYKLGMFHLEVTGPKKISGTMIMPGADETYLVHCDISQHMEKGMKAQLVVGEGGEDLPSIPGLTPYTLTDTYEAEDLPQLSDKTDGDSIINQIKDFFTGNSPIPGTFFIGLLVGLLSVFLITRLPFFRKNNKVSDT